MTHLITHEDPRWAATYRLHGRENGAATYSREIVQFQVPVWEQEYAGAELVIGTCPLLIERAVPSGDVLVQYLHEYRFSNPTRGAHSVAEQYRKRYSSVIFVVAYRTLQVQLEREGLNAIYLPMSIDTHRLEPFAAGYKRTGTLAYYGNAQRPKQSHYRDLQAATAASKYSFRHVKGPQEEAWAVLSQFAYGAGVGRCALEMSALGMKVLITGRSYGGIVRCYEDYVAQQETNFNGRIITGQPFLHEALDDLSVAAHWTPMDSREAAELLREKIRV